VLGHFRMVCEGKPELLFCDNNTNFRSLYGLTDAQGFFKDAFHEYVINGNQPAVNPKRSGTKAAAHYILAVPAGGSTKVDLRLSNAAEPSSASAPSKNSARPGTTKNQRPPDPPGLTDFDSILSQRLREADEFYAELQKDITDDDARRVQRQAF